MNELFGVIFDFNGVLVDDFELQREAWSQVALSLGRSPISPEEMMNIRGKPIRDIATEFSKSSGKNIDPQELTAKKEEVTENLAKNPAYKLTAGLEQFLTELLKNNVSMTIATSSTPQMFDFVFERLALSRWFKKELVIASDGSYPGKPSPDAYILAARKLNLPPSSCIVFEDSIAGLTSAYLAHIGHIVAVGSADILATTTTLPGVNRGIHDFTEITFDALTRL